MPKERKERKVVVQMHVVVPAHMTNKAVAKMVDKMISIGEFAASDSSELLDHDPVADLVNASSFNLCKIANTRPLRRALRVLEGIETHYARDSGEYKVCHAGANALRRLIKKWEG